MRRLRDKIGRSVRTLVNLIRGGAFAGSHRSIRFDEHSKAAVGQSEAIGRMEEREDRFDQIQSALADRYRDIPYHGERSW